MLIKQLQKPQSIQNTTCGASFSIRRIGTIVIYAASTAEEPRFQDHRPRNGIPSTYQSRQLEELCRLRVNERLNS